MSRIDPHLDEVADAYAQLDLEVIRNTRLTNALRAVMRDVEEQYAGHKDDFLTDCPGYAQARAVLDQTNP